MTKDLMSKILNELIQQVNCTPDSDNYSYKQEVDIRCCFDDVLLFINKSSLDNSWMRRVENIKLKLYNEEGRIISGKWYYKKLDLLGCLESISKEVDLYYDEITSYYIKNANQDFEYTLLPHYT